MLLKIEKIVFFCAMWHNGEKGGRTDAGDKGQSAD